MEGPHTARVGASYWADLVRSSYAGGKFIVVAEVLAAATPEVEFLRQQGALRPFVIAGARGTGVSPSPADAEIVVLDLDLPQDAGTRFMPFVRAVETMTDHLPADVLRRIEAWDPEGNALVLQPFLLPASRLAGREPYGGRPASYVALEDKMTVDELWDAAGVRRAPSLVTSLQADALAVAAVDLDWGNGTAWVGDNRNGWHGGAEYLRWVRDPEDAAAAGAFFVRNCDQIRIMPFLEGTPCSIHGIVVGSSVIAVRPIEMLVLGDLGSNRLTYVGSASVWDPPLHIRNEMRGVARRVGQVLHEQHGFRGVFTVDGVVTSSGFLPTELNPRFGAGLGRAVKGIDGLPLPAVNRALVQGENLDYRPAELEELLVKGADVHRNGWAFVQVPEVPDMEVEVPIRFAEDEVVVGDEDQADATIHWGAGTVGGAVMVRLNGERIPIGESVAPKVAAALGYARRNWPVTMPMLLPLDQM